jgi:hypothetical protein
VEMGPFSGLPSHALQPYVGPIRELLPQPDRAVLLLSVAMWTAFSRVHGKTHPPLRWLAQAACGIASIIFSGRDPPTPCRRSRR